MIYAIVFQHNTARYGIHAQSCKCARSTKTQYCWIFEDGKGNTLEAAIESCHQDEREKGGTKANVKVCNCTKEPK